MNRRAFITAVVALAGAAVAKIAFEEEAIYASAVPPISPELAEQLATFDFDPVTGILSLAGQSTFVVYGADGNPKQAVRYRVLDLPPRKGGLVICEPVQVAA